MFRLDSPIKRKITSQINLLFVLIYFKIRKAGLAFLQMSG